MDRGQLSSISGNVDAYKLLSVDATADETTIKKAYRSTALKYHPDKNPDNPSAAEQFHLLTQAYELLLDPARRAKLDEDRAAEEAARRHHDSLNLKRKTLVNQLRRAEQSSHTDPAVISEEKSRLQEIREAWQREINAIRRESAPPEKLYRDNAVDERRLCEEVGLSRADWNRQLDEAERARQLRKEGYQREGLAPVELTADRIPKFTTFPSSTAS